MVSAATLSGLQMCPRCSRNSRIGSQFCGYCGERLNPQRPLLAAGSVLQGRYTIVRLLGMGGMGAVYFCDDAQTGRAWALKSLFDKTFVEQFRLEAATLHRLHHPQLPSVIDYFEENGIPYFVMEVIDGKGLDVIVAEKKKAGAFLPVLTVVRWGVQICDALTYIHGQTPPIIHRDIKPENIKFTPTGMIKLVDFGLLKLYDPAGGLTSRLIGSMGSEGYTAYEQYLNIGATGPGTDIYAFGASLYTLLTNEIPPTPPDRLATPGLLKPARAINSAVPRDLDMAISKAMEIEIGDRYGSAQQFRAALLAAVPGAQQVMSAPTASGVSGVPGSTAALPFRFRDGSAARTMVELAALLEGHVNEGMEYLYDGQLGPWLRSAGRDDLAMRSDIIRQSLSDRRIGLESLTRLLDPTLPAPHLVVDTTALVFGNVLAGAVVSQSVRLSNTRRGYLHGRVQVTAPWLALSSERFGLGPGERMSIRVTVDADTLIAGRDHQAELVITSNGGRQSIPISVGIRRRSLLGLLTAWGATITQM